MRDCSFELFHVAEEERKKELERTGDGSGERRGWRWWAGSSFSRSKKVGTLRGKWGGEGGGGGGCGGSGVVLQ